MKVIAPNKNYTGVSASVAFANGVGQTDDPHLIRWFREHGYTVEEKPELDAVPDPAENSGQQAKKQHPDRKNGSKTSKTAKRLQPDPADNPKDPEEKPELDAMPDPEGEQ